MILTDPNIYRFYNLTTQYVDNGYYDTDLSANNLTRQQFKLMISEFAIGQQAAHELLGHPNPLTYINYNRAICYNMFTKHITVGFDKVAYSINENAGYMTNCHTPDVWLSPDLINRSLGFEESIHAQNYAMDSSLISFNRTANINSEHSLLRARAYYSDTAEVYAGLHLRDYFLSLPEISNNRWHVERLHGTDLYIVNQFRSGNLDHLPNYVKELIIKKGDKLDKLIAENPDFQYLQPNPPSVVKEYEEKNYEAAKRREQNFSEELSRSLGLTNAIAGSIDVANKIIDGNYIAATFSTLQSGLGVASIFAAEHATSLGIGGSVIATIGKGVDTYYKTGSITAAAKAADKEAVVLGGTTLGLAVAPTLLGTGYTSAAIALGAETGAAAVTGTAITGAAGTVIATGGTVLVAGAAVYGGHLLGEKDAETLDANAASMAELREMNSAHFNTALPRDDIRHYDQLNQLSMQSRAGGVDKAAAIDPDALKGFIKKHEAEIAKTEAEKSWTEKGGDLLNKALGNDMLIDSERDKLQLQAEKIQVEIYAKALQHKPADSVAMKSLPRNTSVQEPSHNR